MRRSAALIILCMALLVATPIGAALAKTINGKDGNNYLIGTDKRDAMNGWGGDDVMRGYNRSDVMIGGLDDDRLTGNRGADILDVVDGSDGDFVVCGAGFDRVRADEGDLVSTDCEDVQRVDDTPPPPPNPGSTDCSDNLDNDGDGRTDYPNDRGCSSASDTSEVGGDDDDDDDDD
ncbi:MAG: hypothetical protein H0U91_00820 [Rubrobacter sp.]|nr:hypothetical protein [Rubrobacter sp.]